MQVSKTRISSGNNIWVWPFGPLGTQIFFFASCISITLLRVTMFENQTKCRILIFQFGIFHQFLTYLKWPIARFARTVEWDFFCNFQTSWTYYDHNDSLWTQKSSCLIECTRISRLFCFLEILLLALMMASYAIQKRQSVNETWMLCYCLISLLFSSWMNRATTQLIHWVRPILLNKKDYSWKTVLRHAKLGALFTPLSSHSVWKSPKMSHLCFSISAFSTNLCPFLVFFMNFCSVKM